MTFFKQTDEAAFNQSFGDAVHYFRKSKKMTLQDLADRARISRSSISKIENGKQGITSSTMMAISNALEVSVSDIFVCAELT